MNKTASLSIVTSLALLMISADAAFASEVNAAAQTLHKRVATRQVAITQPHSDRMLNPQPLPPKAKAAAFLSYGSDRALNPQPLPPKEKVAAFRTFGSDRSLNPQPLPPKETLKLMTR